MKYLLLMEDYLDSITNMHGIMRDGDLQLVEVEGRLLGSGGGAGALRVHDIIPYDQLYSLNLQAKNMAAKWYTVGGIDLTYCDDVGVSIGECLRYHMGMFISRLLRHATLLQKLTESPNCSGIHIWGNVPSYLIEFINDLPTSVTILPGRKHSIPTHKKALHKALMLLFPLKKRAGYYFKKIAQGNEQRMAMIEKVQYSDRLHIFAPTNIVSGGFIFSIASHLQAEVFEKIELGNYKPEEGQVIYNKNYEDFNERTKKILESRDYKTLCLTKGSWFKRVLDRWISEWLPRTGASVIKDSILFERFLRERKVSLLMMPMSWGGIDRAYIQTAQKNGIPVIVMQDGILREHSTIPFPPVIADFAFVLGEAGQRWFEQSGIPSNRILQVGSLLWREGDNVATQSKRDDSSSIKSVLYLLPRPGDYGADHSSFETYEEIELVCRILSLFPNIKIMIKFHPRYKVYPGIEKRKETENRIRKVLRRNLIVLNDTENVMSAINRADAVLCYPSTTVIHAAYLKKPVIAVDFSGRGISHATKSGFSGIICRPSELQGTIDDVIKKSNVCVDNWRSTLEEHLSQDCDLSKVIDFIKMITASQGPNLHTEYSSLLPEA